jgi:hypothetical protein
VKERSYLWFRGARSGDVVPVFVEHATPEEQRLFAGVSHDLPESFERRPLPGAPELHEEMPAPDRLVVTGARAGSPLLIRISWLIGPPGSAGNGPGRLS